MIESYKQAIDEFKRVDHLYYVTLKYTRTVDVIKSTVDRLITTYEFAIDALLKCMKEEKVIESIPNNPVGKGDLAKESCSDEEMCKYIDTYLHLRKLSRASYSKREEYRRHVTMVTEMGEKIVNVDIDLLKEYYDEVRNFLTYLKKKVEPYKEIE